MVVVPDPVAHHQRINAVVIMKPGPAIRFSGWSTIAMILFTVTVCACCRAKSAWAGGPAEESHHYRETTGESVTNVKWQLTRSSLLTLTYTALKEQHTTTTGPDYDTVRWRVLADNGKTEFLAERDKNTIVIHGMLSGQPINSVLKIDNAPWYQATSLSLRALIASGDTERVFWTIRSDTLTVNKIRAVKNGRASVELGGSQKELMHIRLTLPGMLAPFWKSDYWFTLPGAVFYRFSGPSGPPGSPMTEVILTVS
jgi:hypothetical protein